MKQIKYTYQERLGWTQVNRPDVYAMVEAELEHPSRIVEILNFNDIPRGYMPNPVIAEVVTGRVRDALRFLEHESPGWPLRAQLMTQTINWVKVYKDGPTKTRYVFQLDKGEVVVHKMKVSLHNQIILNLWQRHVLKEGGDETGIKTKGPEHE